MGVFRVCGFGFGREGLGFGLRGLRFVDKGVWRKTSQTAMFLGPWAHGSAIQADPPHRFIYVAASVGTVPKKQKKLLLHILADNIAKWPSST